MYFLCGLSTVTTNYVPNLEKNRTGRGKMISVALNSNKKWHFSDTDIDKYIGIKLLNCIKKFIFYNVY